MGLSSSNAHIAQCLVGSGIIHRSQEIMAMKVPATILLAVADTATFAQVTFQAIRSPEIRVWMTQEDLEGWLV
jgi:hypothetical protein